jgi:hypothetical protein
MRPIIVTAPAPIDRLRGFDTLPVPVTAALLIAMTFTEAPFCTRSIGRSPATPSNTAVQRPLTLRTATDVDAWAVFAWLSVNVATTLNVPVVG